MSITTTVTSLPTLLSVNRSSTLTIPGGLFKSRLHLTVNACSAPNPFNQSDTTLFTASTNDTFTYSSALHGGFGNITVPATQDEQQVTIVLKGSATDTGSVGDGENTFTYELGLSADSEPWHLLDRLPLFAFEDSDNTTALLTSPTYPSALVDMPSYEALISNTALIRDDLSNSSCYLRSLTSLVPQTSIATTLTRRGVVELSVDEGGAVNETLRGGVRLQYAVSALQTGSNYSIWGLQQNTALNGSNGTGTRLYQRQFFATKSASNCRLLYDVPFCPSLAYSVPAPPSMSTQDLLSIYNSTMYASLQGFNTTLSTFPCNAPIKDSQGRYSFVRTCDQCLEAYTSWLCAVRMPRCVDYEPNQPEAPSSNTIYTYPRTSANDSRTPKLPDSAFPYSELPPCIGVCDLVQASCPPVISNAFPCPSTEKNSNLNASYALPYSRQITFQNVQGGDAADWLDLDLENQDAVDRAQDRFGNVKCNDLGTSALVTRRRYAGNFNLASLRSDGRPRYRSTRMPDLPLVGAVVAVSLSLVPSLF